MKKVLSAEFRVLSEQSRNYFGNLLVCISALGTLGELRAPATLWERQRLTGDRKLGDSVGAF
ncbi:hypothetical protein A6S26_16815 [Nostoc sp. ATCC 43529]|nr:hypothetical protein A6S26_16815 [Nostoc sp. ATCC 43529]